MPSLYELTEQELLLQEMLEGGDIDETTHNDTLESLDIDGKMESIIKFIRNSEAEAAMFKSEKNRMDERQKTAENRVLRLKRLILDYMIRTSKSKVAAGLFTVTKIDKQSVNVSDESLIPKKYFEKIPKLNKTLLNQDAAIRKIRGVEIINKPYIKLK